MKVDYSNFIQIKTPVDKQFYMGSINKSPLRIVLIDIEYVK